MQYKILTYGDPRLRHKGKPVVEVNDEVRRLAGDMLETMRAARGVGLAATQIGLDLMLCVIDVPPEMDAAEPGGPRQNPAIAMPLVLINPEIVETGSEKEVQNEGCLSFPAIQSPIRRAVSVKVRYLDRKGEQCAVEASHLLARAVQHELDHLNGVLLVDRMSPVKKIGLAGQLRRMKKKTAEALDSGVE